jgi:hypothetical protein
MDSALYTLIGALGGVLITQLTNIWMEEKRIHNIRKDAEANFHRSLRKEIKEKRQEVYSQFLGELDYWYATDKNDRLNLMLGHFYSASVIASPKVADKLNEVFRAARDGVSKPTILLELKGELVKLMREDITHD